MRRIKASEVIGYNQCSHEDPDIMHLYETEMRKLILRGVHNLSLMEDALLQDLDGFGR